MLDPLAYLAGLLQQYVLIPLLYRFDWMQWEDASFLWAIFALYGVAQVAVTYLICLPLERFRPLQRWPDRRAVGVDVLYTLVSRIGLFPVVTYFVFYQAQTAINGVLTDHGYVPPTLETLVPFLMGRPLLSFLIYAIVLDFADYWRHRLSHLFNWWYALHAVHHAQEQMTFWSDDRNHILDEIGSFLWFTAVALLIGVPPLEFPVLVLFLRLLESLSHANTSIDFGWFGGRLIISPRFHRAHHGPLAAGQQSCNFGAILPWWDMLFRTADFDRLAVETGDPSAEPAMVSGGWVAQQMAGFRRLGRALRPRARAARQPAE